MPEELDLPPVFDNDPPPVANTEPELTPHPAPDVPRWLYTGPPFRTYAHIPVTVNPGDVIARMECPADDGAWQATDAEATKRPDNHRDDPLPGFGLPLRELTEEEV